MASLALSRRGFLGHVAGAYAATTIVVGTGAASATLDELIDKHQAVFQQWCDMLTVLDEEGETDANRACEQALNGAEEQRRLALLRYRPQSIEEVHRRMAYLIGKTGPWFGILPLEEDAELYHASLMAS